MPHTPQDSVSKWKRVTASEKEIDQEHLRDLCRRARPQTPGDAHPTCICSGFKMGATKTSSGQGWEHEGKLKKAIQAKLHYLRCVLPLLVMMGLVACGDRAIGYKGTCGQQTQQFLDHIHSVVIDELNPATEEGFRSGPTAGVMKRLEQLDSRISELNTPECNPRTQAVKDALRLYILATRNYFMTVAGRAVYGEGQVQGHLSAMYEAGMAFERAFADVRR